VQTSKLLFLAQMYYELGYQDTAVSHVMSQFAGISKRRVSRSITAGKHIIRQIAWYNFAE